MAQGGGVELNVFWRTLRRRWYLTSAVLMLTIGATAYVADDVGPRYEAQGSTLVFPPASSTESEDGATKTVGNPYLELAGVGQARDVVIRTLKSRTVQADWSEDFPGMTYEASPDFTNSAPIILFTVEGETRTGAAAALDDLMARVPTILLELQDGLGLNDESLVTARTLTQDARPTVVHKAQIRAGLLAAAVAAGLGLLLLALIDSLPGVRTRVRTERRAARAADETLPPDEEDPSEVVDEAGSMAEASSVDDAAEPEPEPDNLRGPSEPVHVYRVRVESDMAVSPARSKWPHALNGPNDRDRGPRSLSRPTPARTRATGRNS